MRRAFFSTDEGITLLEVLLGIVLLGVISVALLASFTDSISFTHKNETRAQAVKLAAEVLEVIKADFNENWPDISERNPNDYLDMVTSSDDDLRSNYTITWDVEDKSVDDFEGRHISVKIKTSYDGIEVSLDTLIRKR